MCLLVLTPSPSDPLRFLSLWLTRPLSSPASIKIRRVDFLRRESSLCLMWNESQNENALTTLTMWVFLFVRASNGRRWSERERDFLFFLSVLYSTVGHEEEVRRETACQRLCCIHTTDVLWDTQTAVHISAPGKCTCLQREAAQSWDLQDLSR